MKKVQICFGMYSSFSEHCEETDAVKNYERVYKKLVSFLYDTPSCGFTFYFTGQQLQWFEQKHPEFLTLIEELVARKQVEILGGGFYAPFFPLLLPVDRVGQIELLNTAVRKIFGKRPRGIFLTESVWDSSLISTFKTCGFDYVLLHGDFLFKNAQESCPLIIEEMGKSMYVLPTDSSSNFTTDSISSMPQQQLLFCKFFSENELALLLEKSDFTECITRASTKEDSVFTIPTKSIKVCNFQKSYISASISKNIAQWLQTPYTKTQNTKMHAQTCNIKNFLLLYPEILHIYSRMTFTANFLNQIRGDKARKKSAREELWMAQNHLAYMYSDINGITNSKVRKNTYKHLITAEKIAQPNVKPIKNISSFDFNADGKKEYIAQFDFYNAFIHHIGGMLYEFDIIQNAKNYANVLCQNISSDQFFHYEKKLFVDHFMSPENKHSMKKTSLHSIEPVFAKNSYQEVAFNRARDEIILKTTGEIENVKVSIKKKYHFYENGITVQYILKNESDSALVGYFAVENNFSLSPFSSDMQKINMIAAGLPVEIPLEKDHYYQQDVSYMQITDTDENISFIFEINENADISIFPFYTKSCIQTDEKKCYEATTVLASWFVNLQPLYEAERTISLLIRPVITKKIKRKSK